MADLLSAHLLMEEKLVTIRPLKVYFTHSETTDRVRGSPCGYEAHQLNSWYTSRLKRLASLALTEEKQEQKL